jgi:NTP pyrophosphatase (non-canonical NTP hydrolase)
MWLFTFVGKVRGAFGQRKPGERSPEEAAFRVRFAFYDIVWSKYPLLCPVCFQRNGNRPRGNPENGAEACHCLLHPVEDRSIAETAEQKVQLREAKELTRRELQAHAASLRDRKVAGMDELQRMFAQIFKANIEHLSLSDIAFHLLEEVGEVSDALLRLYTYRVGTVDQPGGVEDIPVAEIERSVGNLEDELADVASWMFTLVIKLDKMKETVRGYLAWLFGTDLADCLSQEILLSQIIWKAYGSDREDQLWCEACGRLKCKCPLVFVTTEDGIQILAGKLPQREPASEPVKADSGGQPVGDLGSF